MRRGVLPIIVTLGLGMCGTGGAVPRGGIAACSNVLDRKLEVCVAYVANATLAARVPFYELGRSSDPARVRLARYRLESRYVDGARRRLELQVSRWPVGPLVVGLPRLSILSVGISGDRATLVTRETWHVQAANGRVLFAEAARRHTIEMRRIRGLLLHKWVVSVISA